MTWCDIDIYGMAIGDWLLMTAVFSLGIYFFCFYCEKPKSKKPEGGVNEGQN